MRHRLVDNTLIRTQDGIVGRCECGWTTGPRFSSFSASALFQDHVDGCADQPSEAEPVAPANP